MIKSDLLKFVQDTEDPILNFELGFSYYKEENIPSAINYFLRTAEISEDNFLRYKCLVYCSNCLFRQGDRSESAKKFILQAISTDPKRPEAWFLYLRILEANQEKDWELAYTSSCVAESLCEFGLETFEYSDYVGPYAIRFIKARSALFLERGQECRKILQSIVDEYWDSMNSNYQYWVEEEIKNLGVGSAEVAVKRYDKSKFETYKFKFEGLENIETNYSQTYQDMFVLSIYKGKRNGTYLEIGSGDPFYNNNTALLESFEWKGNSIEIQENLIQKFNSNRKNKAHFLDATKVDYRKFLRENYKDKHIDYLQLDCEPSKTTFEILLSLPLDEFKFGVITFEHDYSIDMTRSYKDK